jgi:hypothetical protein
MLSTIALGHFSRSYLCKDDTKLIGKKILPKSIETGVRADIL